MNPTQDSPYQYRPRSVVARLPAMELAANRLGLLEEEAFEAGAETGAVSATLAKYFPDCTFETRAPGKSPGPTVISFESLVNEDHRSQQSSGVRIVGGQPNIWVEEIDGRVNLVAVLREAGAMIEVETGRLLGMMKGQSELMPKSGKRKLTFTRRVTPGHFLASAGYISQDASREYINSHAAVLQSLSLALLFKMDPRLVFIDVFERAREDALMFTILGAMASRSGVDFTDRKELSEYAATYFELVTGEDVYYPNLHQVNALASYFAQHLRLNKRLSASAR